MSHLACRFGVKIAKQKTRFLLCARRQGGAPLYMVATSAA